MFPSHIKDSFKLNESFMNGTSLDVISEYLHVYLLHIFLSQRVGPYGSLGSCKQGFFSGPSKIAGQILPIRFTLSASKKHFQFSVPYG